VSAAAVFVALRCNWCSKQRPSFRVHQLASRQAICDYCLDWHNEALLMLAGGIPAGCQKCQRTWAQLRDETLGAEVRMYVVPKDGIYQLLCASCVKPYLPKRADLYRGTKFGSETLKLDA
jgi:hypothetical protein